MHTPVYCSPYLTWRDVQYLIVYTANPNLTAGTMITNGAGLHVSRQYGFGVIDGEAMVARAQHWKNVPPQIGEHLVATTQYVSTYINFNNNDMPFVEKIHHL